MDRGLEDLTLLPRRAFLSLLAAGVMAPAAAAQSPARVHRVGILAPTAPPRGTTDATTLRIPRYLEELGYVAGRTLIVEHRYAAGRLEDLPALARDLVRLRMDVIVAIGSSAVRAVRRASTRVPIVMLGNFDPVALGLVKSLAKPEGNVTGVLIAPAGSSRARSSSCSRRRSRTPPAWPSSPTKIPASGSRSRRPWPRPPRSGSR